MILLNFLLIVFVAPPAALLVAWATRCVVDQHRARQRSRAPWVHYCCPAPDGSWQVGVQRVHRGDVICKIHMQTLHGDVDEVERIINVDKAKTRAARYNQAREDL